MKTNATLQKKIELLQTKTWDKKRLKKYFPDEFKDVEEEVRSRNPNKYIFISKNWMQEGILKRVKYQRERTKIIINPLYCEVFKGHKGDLVTLTTKYKGVYEGRLTGVDMSYVYLGKAVMVMSTGVRVPYSSVAIKVKNIVEIKHTKKEV